MYSEKAGKQSASRPFDFTEAAVCIAVTDGYDQIGWLDPVPDPRYTFTKSF